MKEIKLSIEKNEINREISIKVLIKLSFSLKILFYDINVVRNLKNL